MTAPGKPEVSIIIPCRNEADWIARCLESILRNDYPKDQMEVLIIDGMSDDGTQAIVDSFAAERPFIRLLENPRRITPAALNIGLAASQGQVIVRMDAHNEYPTNYISSLVHWLEKSGADNVGGVWHTCPGADTALARAIAVALSHPFGVGNAHYRLGVKEPRWVDTVPFGCYRRDVFERIGTFDEELVRNQDDELNLRLIRAGGRILLVPEVVSKYYTRDSLRKLWRMYYQYGYFKPLVVRKIGRVMTFRQIVPSLLLTALALSGIAAFWSKLALASFAVVLGSYLLAVVGVSLGKLPKHGVGCALGLITVFPTLHFAYAFGFFRGMLDFLVLRRKGAGDESKVPISR